MSRIEVDLKLEEIAQALKQLTQENAKPSPFFSTLSSRPS